MSGTPDSCAYFTLQTRARFHAPISPLQLAHVSIAYFATANARTFDYEDKNSSPILPLQMAHVSTT